MNPRVDRTDKEFIRETPFLVVGALYEIKYEASNDTYGYSKDRFILLGANSTVVYIQDVSDKDTYVMPWKRIYWMNKLKSTNS